MIGHASIPAGLHRPETKDTLSSPKNVGCDERCRPLISCCIPMRIAGRAKAEAATGDSCSRPATARRRMEVKSAEPQTHGERLELLAVVRGLEGLEQPSRVTLVTSSRYVSRGLTMACAIARQQLALGTARRDGADQESRSVAAVDGRCSISTASNAASSAEPSEGLKLGGRHSGAWGKAQRAPAGGRQRVRTKSKADQSRKAQNNVPRRLAGARFALPQAPARAARSSANCSIAAA